jgi:hypothetical protein
VGDVIHDDAAPVTSVSEVLAVADDDRRRIVLQPRSTPTR